MREVADESTVGDWGSKDGASRSGPLRGLAVAGGGLVLGLLGDGLLRSTPWGLNLALWVTALAAAVQLLTPERARAERAMPFAATALVFAWLTVVRDSPTLLALNLMALLVALAIAAWRARDLPVRDVELSRYAQVAASALRGVIAGPPRLLFQDISLQGMSGGSWQRRSRSLIVGLLLSAPVLFVFGGLLMSADAVFERLVLDAFVLDVQQTFVHLFFIAFWGWLASGFLRDTAFETDRGPSLPIPRSGGLGLVEVGIPLALLNLLFLSFVMVQLRYLFGGSELVQVTPGLSYAEYARRGFFELVNVVTLTIPLLLVAHWALRRDAPGVETVFRVLAGATVLLVMVIMFSAFRRMGLYWQAYGLTVDRFYATAFMCWLAVLLTLFVTTVLAGHRERFAFGALVSGFVAVVALNIANPDAIIARVNMNRAATQALDLDVSYLTTISADAVPTIMGRLDRLVNVRQREEIAHTLRNRWAAQAAETDWRTWNWSRSMARRALQVGLGISYEEED